MLNLGVLAEYEPLGSRRAVAFLVPLALLATTGVIYLAGGTEGRFHAIAHLYYVPVIIAAFTLGPKAGVLSALAAALLGGPKMPADVGLRLMQPASDWLTRAFSFVLVGATVGVLAARLRSALLAERRHLEQLSRFGDEALSAFTQVVAQRNLYTGGHVSRIAGYATDIARRLGLSLAQIETIRYAAQLHDIGKLAIPTEILRKPGHLSRREWNIIREHPSIGSRILEQVTCWQAAAPLVLHHHERYDGAGYPAGLRGDAIPLGARIIAVADAFDTMVSDRPYRRAMSPAEAADELRTEAGTQFDPRVVRAFLDAAKLNGSEPASVGFAGVAVPALAGDALLANVIHHNGKCHVDVQ